MTSNDPMVFVIDDDFRVREALSELLAVAGLRAAMFASATEYFRAPRVDGPGCLVVDVCLADTSGLELQREIADSSHPPIVFITGRGDVPSSVRAMKAGAVDFLTKPFSERELLHAIDLALAKDRAARIARSEKGRLQARLQSLTPRELDVLPLVVGGFLNKQAAARLGISEVTFQIHRSKVMKKMQASSLPELVRMADALGIPLPDTDASRRVA